MRLLHADEDIPSLPESAYLSTTPAALSRRCPSSRSTRIQFHPLYWPSFACNTYPRIDDACRHTRPGLSGSLKIPVSSVISPDLPVMSFQRQPSVEVTILFEWYMYRRPSFSVASQ